jgi:hypothetical protein
MLPYRKAKGPLGIINPIRYYATRSAGHMACQDGHALSGTERLTLEARAPALTIFHPMCFRGGTDLNARVVAEAPTVLG